MIVGTGQAAPQLSLPVRPRADAMLGAFAVKRAGIDRDVTFASAEFARHDAVGFESAMPTPRQPCGRRHIHLLARPQAAFPEVEPFDVVPAQVPPHLRLMAAVTLAPARRFAGATSRSER